MAKSDRLYEEARQAIQRVFGDTSVSPGQTRITLETLKEEIDNLICSLPEGGKTNEDGED
ncbi:hypothetical protein OIU34_21100 [Pararhizobium sp. BT-229]|uniref:hypothetical protein n=1 Tax=Pararhizobium sp. BT-229 TaxID=2986923 RepID=UPI0021F6E33A|nr:hypothetical protein [Pararhizobium sp. BT-229]MCV9964389.1 hypothetical protein [Pararhizobium sp. BT-229]